MAASTISSIHINKRSFTKQNHDDVVNEQEICLPNITSSLKWNLFLKKALNISLEVKLGFSFLNRLSTETSDENMIITSIYDHAVLWNVKKHFKR